jgi:hypothetical protein
MEGAGFSNLFSHLSNGIDLAAGGTVTNTGQIYASWGCAYNADTGFTGVRLAAGGTVTDSGIISGGNGGDYGGTGITRTRSLRTADADLRCPCLSGHPTPSASARRWP